MGSSTLPRIWICTDGLYPYALCTVRVRYKALELAYRTSYGDAKHVSRDLLMELAVIADHLGLGIANPVGIARVKQDLTVQKQEIDRSEKCYPLYSPNMSWRLDRCFNRPAWRMPSAKPSKTTGLLSRLLELLS